tara:strand:+ start:280 stop:501 length:222 start_codon:yes stop_codon:yes gene_type:complete
LTTERDEHKRSPVYKKLSPKAKKAVDEVMKMLSKTPSKVLSTFPKIIKDVSIKFGIKPKDIETYFAKETGLTI